MPELRNNNRVPRTPKRRTHPRSTNRDNINFGHILQNSEDDLSQSPESWGILDKPPIDLPVLSEVPPEVWKPYMEDHGYKSQPEGAIIPYQAFHLEEDEIRKHHLEEFARVAGQDFLNFAFPEINVIFGESQKEHSDSNLGSITDNIPTETWDTLGQPSGKFDFLVKYFTPASSRICIADIQPTGRENLSEYDMPIEDVYIPLQASRPNGKRKMNGRVRTKKRVTKSDTPMINTITDNNPKQDMPYFIMHNGIRHYWKAVEVSTVVHRSK